MSELTLVERLRAGEPDRCPGDDTYCGLMSEAAEMIATMQGFMDYWAKRCEKLEADNNRLRAEFVEALIENRPQVWVRRGQVEGYEDLYNLIFEAKVMAKASKVERMLEPKDD